MKDFRILLVDEGREEPRLARILSGFGCPVERCAADESALAAVRHAEPDVVVLDLGAGGSEGLVTLRRILTNRSTRHIPVIVTAAQAALEYELLDAFDFLVHPVDERRLLEDLALLAGHRGERDVLPEELPGQELELFQDYLHRHSGLHFDRRNAKLLERGLARRMRALGLASYRRYFDYLENHAESRRELGKLLGLLTVGETYFFRYLPHFEALVLTVLPEVLRRNHASRRLRIWSAGCSTGEEPYSIALVLAEHFPQLAGWQVEILATDVNKQALKGAREGLFGPRSVRLVEPGWLEKYFRREGRHFRLEAGIRERVRFEPLNLQTGSYPAAENGTADLDMIFCRNVMIYFRPETTRKIVERFASCLRPRGYLFLGHSETLMNISERFSRVSAAGGFLYQLDSEKEGRHLQPEAQLSRPPAAVREELPGWQPEPGSRPAPALPAAPATPLPAAGEPQRDYLQAREAFDKEDFAVAQGLFARVLEAEPGHVGALLGMGFVHANQGRYEQAQLFCEQALAEDDLCPEAYFLRGLLAEGRDDPEAAAGDYRRALWLEMKFILPHYNLSRIHARLGRPAEARRELRNVIRLLEKSPAGALVPCSGGVSREVFLEICRRELAAAPGPERASPPVNPAKNRGSSR
ncbi:hypothetical protein DESUT3_40350 [Desulfuromonas versatilis]|uniref:protein-glutamate O-methyltransferase n=1 Tax=Desulfuromonas versatilis TaxID=2802975 RepID=A0ABN6E3Q1_9BACT|nr:CheR family methyltransferase [Desulfuromonas versatilis]BCR06966.1 hypothetical protein DESUT3_40350 [Desulfuromonas versatilis]